MWKWITKYASPMHFYLLVNRLTPWFGWSAAVLFIVGLYGAFFYAPADYQQGESFRIIYVHVPSAWMSMFVYMVMAGAGAAGLIWKTKVSDAVARSCAPLGASFTFLALVTGSLWGKPMWGTWWVWDARLTSVLILFFLYLGYIALWEAIENRQAAARSAAILA
ncbi:MAG: cytochrome c biogenesis protein CcsA, partial [Gammaproteobacteria bacterium]|nr:cytochrome c biogenesis protein CcsA [Gammaproteobacteria bacterium]